MAPNQIKGIHCPSCGLHEAIVRYYEGSLRRSSWSVEHSHCGFKRNATFLIGDILDEVIGDGLYTWNEEPRVPTITLKLDLALQAAEALAKVKSVFGALIIQPKIILTVAPSTFTCPICGSPDLEPKHFYLSCGDHYLVNVDEFFIGYIKSEGYEVSGHGDAFRVYRVIRPPTGFWNFIKGEVPYNVSVAQLEYRRNGDQHFLILSRPEFGYDPETYGTFTHTIEDGLGKFYKVIVKRED
ncbi:hypothetical protein COT86_00875 [Candidatus Collierbacteria bacterium CG10_big_fil_rev_8_21_14_0_10_43_36]|uniref:Uncharacterized protein n=2 Tax=Candidatus Collieribacteriota TaxID=1752725 RepID=A0A2H0DU38_9BACT|nr:MAG: hypothetical protein COW83_05370 [Candidatus Collierbacteria bacterium CG22_combo_CG10-13_8_21_14_all_43_12]PIS00020.1 MAG: hypothetical protein COT86_00875 [Candidatus Collierbacteria bacterium CG10_big_fil_rev_8_21_14_0_10_43_36]